MGLRGIQDPMGVFGTREGARLWGAPLQRASLSCCHFRSSAMISRTRAIGMFRAQTESSPPLSSRVSPCPSCVAWDKNN
jgi:hypothetical protein